MRLSAALKFYFLIAKTNANQWCFRDKIDFMQPEILLYTLLFALMIFGGVILMLIYWVLQLLEKD